MTNFSCVHVYEKNIWVAGGAILTLSLAEDVCHNNFSLFGFNQLILERSDTEIKQRFNNQIEKSEREIAQLKKKLENEVEQRHALTKNQDVSIKNKKNKLFPARAFIYSYILL